jgi:prepilin-type processing-associated H-X9-DG protein
LAGLNFTKTQQILLGIGDAEEWNGNMNTQFTTRSGKAFTMIELLFVMVVLFILAAIFLQPESGSKRKAQRINCVNNLKQIGLAFRIWKGNNGDRFPMEISATNADVMKLITNDKAYVFWQMMSNELSTPKILHCTADTEHAAATNFTTGFSDANISYFFNLDGDETYPQMILTGDDNLVVDGTRVEPGVLNISTNSFVAWTKERHNEAANIGLADGSVQQTISCGFNLALTNSTTTNQPAIRFVIP